MSSEKSTSNNYLRWKSQACIKERLSTSAHTSQSPTKKEKKDKQQRLKRIRRLSAMRFGLRLALLKPAALPVSPLPVPPLSLLLLLECILCLVIVILFKLFIAWQCSLVTSWFTLCVGTPKFSKEFWCTDCRLCPRLQ